MRIILTGASGFVGARLKIALEKSNYEVFAIDRDKVNVYNISELREHILKNVKLPFTIVHCAAVSDTKTCEENKKEAYKANVIYTKNLADICSDFSIPLIFLSSDQVYDYFGEKDHYEYNNPKPTNYYGLTKLWAENAIREICPTHHILRLTWQFDTIRRDVPNKGIIKQICDTAEQGGVIRQSKKSYRYITWVNATILYIMRMIERNVPYGTYNVASVTEMSCYDIYKYTFEAMGMPYKKYLKCDNSMKPINLTPYPYNLDALGFEIIKYEDTVDNLMKEIEEKMAGENE